MAAGMTSAASEASAPVGIVAGGGAMPFAVAESLAARGIMPVLFALRGACDPVQVEKFRHRWISVGQLGRAMRLFREEGCRDQGMERLLAEVEALETSGAPRPPGR